MKLYGIGNALLYYREKKGLSQSQVCAGICPEMTLSRIETGEREFDSMISETLLERIGKTANRFEFVLNEKDYRLYELRERIKNYADKKDVRNLREELKSYKNTMPQNSVLHEQFVLYYEAMLLKTENGDVQNILWLLHEAIELTRSDYKEKTAQMILYSSMEIKIIYQLFLYESYTEQMLYSVMRFVNEMYDEEEKIELLIPFYVHLVQRYEEEKKYVEVKRIADEAIDLIQRGRSYLYLTDFYFYALKATSRLYKSAEDWTARRMELVEKCNELYYMSMIIEDNKTMEQVKQFCEEYLGCRITI